MNKLKKLNLLGQWTQNNDFRSNYVNITEHPQIPEGLPQDIVVLPGQFRNLEPLSLEPQEEIIFNPFLNILTPNELPQILHHWGSKLAPNGVLKLTYIDIRKVGRAISSGELSLEQSHSLTIGINKEYNSLIDTVTIRTVCQGLGFEIDSISNVDYYGNIEVIKKELDVNTN